MTMPVITSVGKKLLSCAARLHPTTTLAPFLTASRYAASTFSTALIIDQWPDQGTRLKPVGDLHRTGGLGQPLGEGVIDPVLNQNG
jgi:hypothetical protein